MTALSVPFYFTYTHAHTHTHAHAHTHAHTHTRAYAYIAYIYIYIYMAFTLLYLLRQYDFTLCTSLLLSSFFRPVTNPCIHFPCSTSFTSCMTFFFPKNVTNPFTVRKVKSTHYCTSLLFPFFFSHEPPHSLTVPIYLIPPPPSLPMFTFSLFGGTHTLTFSLLDFFFCLSRPP
jgi:hypothetical protein